MTLLILFASISIFFSFLCSILEAVFLSIPSTFINLKKKEGKLYAHDLEKLKLDVDKPLITILTINTIAHTVGAILVGVEAEKLPYKVEFFGINFVGIVSALMTFLILVASEIIPKTIGATYWRQLAHFTTKMLKILIFPLKWTGILWLLRLTTRLIGGSHKGGSYLSRDDFSAMADLASKEGVFEESESKIIKNLLEFESVRVKEIMTPRSVMETVDEETTVGDYTRNKKDLQFSRIPLYLEDPDNITGFVLMRDVYQEFANHNEEKRLADLRREILIVQRSVPIPELFETLVGSRNHLAVVVDEFGSVNGLATLEDIIETLLGREIMDESDKVADLQKLARKKFSTKKNNS